MIFEPDNTTAILDTASQPEEETTPEADSSAEETEPALSLTELKGRVEAALFVTNKPLSIADMVELLGTDPYSVEEALMELMNDYAFRPDTALEIGDADGYILQIREEFRTVSDSMMPMELPASSLRILSAIAIKGPILQSELVETQGSAVYDAVPELMERGLVSKNRVGRSYRLNVTQKFNEYFRLVGDKQELRIMVGLLEGDVPERNTGKAIRLTDASQTDAGASHDDIGDDSQVKYVSDDDDA